MFLKKINIIGGGPAGLYFAILMKEINPDTEINVIERNDEDDIVGWGIVLNLGTLDLLKKCDLESYEGIIEKARHWSDVDIFHKDQKITVHGKEYISLSRMMLLTALRKRCKTLNIDIQYGQAMTNVDEYLDCDLLVGADGAYSLVRETFKEQFKPSIDMRKNKFTWLGTNKIFDTITHVFKNTPDGVFTAEGYGYSDTHSTFIPTCAESTWVKAGFENMSSEETLAYLSDVFKDELCGHPLLGYRSVVWNNFPLIKNENWVCSKVLLLGDALHTAHFSIGSGTRLGLEDAIVASKSINEQDDLNTALTEFEKSRRPFMERYQDVAFESLQWFENVDNLIDLELVPFAFEVMTRSNKLGIRSLKLQDPEFVKLYMSTQNN